MAFPTAPAPVPSSILEKSIWTINTGQEIEGNEKSLRMYLILWWAYTALTHTSELQFLYLSDGDTKSTFLLRCLWERDETQHLNT